MLPRGNNTKMGLGNVKRFVRRIYKAAEKHKKDLEEERREMKRVEQASSSSKFGPFF